MGLLGIKLGSEEYLCAVADDVCDDGGSGEMAIWLSLAAAASPSMLDGYVHPQPILILVSSGESNVHNTGKGRTCVTQEDSGRSRALEYNRTA